MMPVRRTQSWLPSIFNDFFDNDWMVKANATAPAINVFETEKEYKVELAAPGMTKEDFNVRIDEDNNLVISMEITRLLSSSMRTLKSSFVIPGAASSTLYSFSVSKTLIAGAVAFAFTIQSLSKKSLKILGNQL